VSALQYIDALWSSMPDGASKLSAPTPSAPLLVLKGTPTVMKTPGDPVMGPGPQLLSTGGGPTVWLEFATKPSGIRPSVLTTPWPVSGFAQTICV
jgi:hypothetical protein